MTTRIAQLAAAAALVAIGTTPGFAQTTGAIAATATVTTECNITATPLAFGEYDPVGAHQAADLDGTATITLTCTKGAVASVALSLGLNASGSTRQMRSMTGDSLTYELHQDSSRLFVWNEEITSLLTLGPALSMAPRDLTVHGRVFGGQDVRAGTYTDSVLATVNF